MIWILVLVGLSDLVACGLLKSKEDRCLTNYCSVEDLEARCIQDQVRRKKYRCLCSPGFVELGGTCDRDECHALKNICTMGGDKKAECKNTRGSYDCTCSFGYTNDNGTCTSSARYVSLDGSVYNYGILGFLASTLLSTTVAGLAALGITYGTYHKRKARLSKRRRNRNRKVDNIIPNSEHYFYRNSEDVVVSSDEIEKVIQVFNYIVCDKNEDGKFSCRYN